MKIKSLERDILMLGLVMKSVVDKEPIHKQEIAYLKEHHYLDKELSKENMNEYNLLLKNIQKIVVNDILDKINLKINEDMLYQFRTIFFDNIKEKIIKNNEKIQELEMAESA